MIDELMKQIQQQADELARMRSVCRECSGVLMRQYDKMTLDQVQQLPWLSAAIVTVAQDMAACGDGACGDGKESKWRTAL